jgi:hypothetical protein
MALTDDDAEGRGWRVMPADLRIQGETIVLGAKDKLPYAAVDIDNHVMAVIVFGDSQQVADERAQLIVDAVRRFTER